jgi:hypothetical protein
MDERVSRFKHCEPQFHPYLDRVFSRIPADLRDEILDDEGFDIVADKELPEICGRCFCFDHPVEKLVYLNPKALMQPDHRLLCSIAWEIADYVAGKEGKAGDEHRVEELLVGWGFEREIDSVCFCDAVAGSTAFKSGYEWAKGQSEEYLMLHFGLYFDEWNEKGLARMSGERVESLRRRFSASKLLPDSARRTEKEVPEGFSIDDVFMEGIMAAVKEIKSQEQAG